MSPGSDPGETRSLEEALGEMPICLRRPIWLYKNLIAETNRMLALHGLLARPFPAEDMTLYQAPWSKWDGAAFESSGARAQNWANFRSGAVGFFAQFLGKFCPWALRKFRPILSPAALYVSEVSLGSDPGDTRFR